MDDSCAVCAEALEWVAYGPCGHREVCSTCVARLRFICNDRLCCICKSETRNIFVTKDLGEFTKTITDFSVLPSNPSEGQVGSYWYHEATQAYFDDFGHYKMIKAMCDLSCGACAKINEHRQEGLKRRTLFENIEQLKSHLFQQHKLFMCGLCLEGRKVFICEQKLYTDKQLQQHVKRGDSDVDGNETERGGFMGHPLCEFCANPFYGENELYKHMTTEHYTCHICQRQRPGQYEYYRDYNDLEVHFSQRHYLCEDESCLAKKFIVFVTESEMKRHNAIEHKGHMSRSKRNAVLQIPISFQYRRINELDDHGRGHEYRNAPADSELSMAIQASLETAPAVRSRETSSAFQSASGNQRMTEFNSTINSLELLNLVDIEPSSRYHHVLGQSSSSASLMESSFPPLPKSSKSSRRKHRNNHKSSGAKNIASGLHNQNNGNKNTYSSHALNAATSGTSYLSGSSKTSPITLSANSSGPARMPSSVFSEPNPSSHTNLIKHGQVRAQGDVSADFLTSRMCSSSSTIGQSASAPYGGSSGPSLADFPPISASQTDKLHTGNKPLQKMENVHSANKSLVENIRASLEFDEDKYAAFKIVSAEFRHDVIDSREYLAYIHQFGLSHLVSELARLCPDSNKRKELIETVNLNGNSSVGYSKKKEVSTKGKDKCYGNVSDSLNYALNNDSAGKASNLQSNDSKGKSKITDVDEHVNFSSPSSSQSKGTTENVSAGCSRKGDNKQRKKVPKFLRNRIGDDPTTVLSHFNEADRCPGLTAERRADDRKDSTSKLPVRGVWQNGGGRKLVAMTQRRPTK